MNYSQKVTTSLKPYCITFTWGNTLGNLCAKLQKMQKPEMLNKRVCDLLLQGNEDLSTHGMEAALSNQEAYL